MVTEEEFFRNFGKYYGKDKVEALKAIINDRYIDKQNFIKIESMFAREEDHKALSIIAIIKKELGLE